MDQTVIKAILLKATDYRESDRLVRLLSVENGIVNAVMKGVKKPKAKLKWASQQLSFAEYTLARGKGGFYTVTGASQIEDLSALSYDYEKYLYASLAAECADAATDRSNSPQIFVGLLKCLKDIMFSDGTSGSLKTAAKFIYGLVKSGGEFTADRPVPENKAELRLLIRRFESTFGVNLKSATIL